jgi:hypothetical protein
MLKITLEDEKPYNSFQPFPDVAAGKKCIFAIGT